jgi:hypothetical protein
VTGAWLAIGFDYRVWWIKLRLGSFIRSAKSVAHE